MRSGCLTLSVKLTAVESAFLAAVFPFLVFEFAPVFVFLLLPVDVAVQLLDEPPPPAVFESSFVPPVAAGFSFALLAVFEFSFVLPVAVESSFALLVVAESFSAPPAVVEFSFVLLQFSFVLPVAVESSFVPPAVVVSSSVLLVSFALLSALPVFLFVPVVVAFASFVFPAPISLPLLVHESLSPPSVVEVLLCPMMELQGKQIQLVGLP